LHFPHQENLVNNELIRFGGEDELEISKEELPHEILFL
jgi:hypothetical protein